MTDILGVFGAVVITLVMSLVLGGAGFRGARLVCTVGTVLLYLVTLTLAGEIFTTILPLTEGDSIGEAARSVLKIVGVSYAASFVSDMCRDMGEVGMSNAVVTVGRVEILLITAPYAVGIAELAIELMGG